MTLLIYHGFKNRKHTLNGRSGKAPEKSLAEKLPSSLSTTADSMKAAIPLPAAAVMSSAESEATLTEQGT